MNRICRSSIKDLQEKLAANPVREPLYFIHCEAVTRAFTEIYAGLPYAPDENGEQQVQGITVITQDKLTPEEG